MSEESVLVRRDVAPELEQKVYKIALAHDTFTTKQVFEVYPDNPEFLLRYALNNLRIDKKIFMYGNKRGAYYSIKSDCGGNCSEAQVTTKSDKCNDVNLKESITSQALQFNRWFKRTELECGELSIPTILTTIKELLAEGILVTQGSMRWTEYKHKNVSEANALVSDTSTSNTRRSTDATLKPDILKFIKDNKVATIPMISDKFNLQRYMIIPIINQLVEEEEIWHEGLGRASKYIHKDTPYSEVEKTVQGLIIQRKIDQEVDDLSDFLCSDEVTCVSIGFNKDDVFEVKSIASSYVKENNSFSNISDGIKYLVSMTVVR